MREEESKKNIDDVLNSGQGVIIDVITRFLQDKELFKLGLSNLILNGVIANIGWKVKLKQDIGSDAKSLMAEGETYQQTYLRHKTIISALEPINSFGQMTTRLTAYPHYYLSAVKDADFARLINGIFALERFCKIFPTHADSAIKRVLDKSVDFPRERIGIDTYVWTLKGICEKFPSHADIAFERILDNSDDFAREIGGILTLKTFCKDFPSYADIAIKRILTNSADFARIFEFVYPLNEFCKNFPSYAHTAIKRILDNPADFSRLIKTVYNLRDFCNAFPTHTDAVIRRILDNPVYFARIFENDVRLKVFCKHFPTYVDRVKMMPDYMNIPSIPTWESFQTAPSHFFPPADSKRETLPKNEKEKQKTQETTIKNS